ncbi:alpha/beta hydrolase [Thalassotalea sp. M1531]|uniref:Alpha/beta hydrolase n=1 Tax=Thalassotalea algicola TaxID=2716224 RepID=A0A7Y0Q7V0_9GAMM|nr:alpha/beta hydrolase [Thalassotalea algicola]NMP32586.1 alpha/beta hydrolase [Thalassotalea algicola]
MTHLIEGIHFDKFSRHGEHVHFYGANGFPTKVYRSFINLLAENYTVSSLHNRATWPNQHPPKKLNWSIYADDLIRYLDSYIKHPVIGIGHSMGATTTLLAAIKRPDLFCKLVLIEPAMSSPVVSKLLPLIPFQLAKRIQPIKYTVKKPAQWRSEQEFYNDCRQRRVFKRISDENLAVLAKHSLYQELEQLNTLKFPKIWEARNYASAPNIYKQFAKNTLPVVAIRGKPSAYFSNKSWEKWQQIATNTIFQEDLNFGHLFPLESPQKCAALIDNGLTLLKNK